MKSVYCMFAHCQSLHNFLSVSQSAALKEWTSGTLVCCLLSQNIVSSIVSLPIRRWPSKYMNVVMWEHCIFDSDIFGCVKV
jgi:hypothetical protein